MNDTTFPSPHFRPRRDCSRRDFSPYDRPGCDRLADHRRRGILDAVGNTPLVRLMSYLDRDDIELYAKLESANPGGSAKDRPALAMIDAAMRAGQIGPRTTVIESSSGNMGIGLAQACRYLGLRFVCVVDPFAQPNNVDIIRALGGEIDLVNERVNDDFLSARLARVCELLETTPDSFWPNQYSNLANPAAHQAGTIREIDDELGDSLDFLFVATSSTGTLRGCVDYLAAHGRSTSVVAVDAFGSALFGGQRGPRVIPGLGAGRVSKLATDAHCDELQRISTRDCIVGCRRAALREAFLPGGSAGGVLEAVRRMEDRLAGATVAAILHDSGTRYLETIYSDRWVEETLGKSVDDILSDKVRDSAGTQAASTRCEDEVSVCP